MISKDPRHLEWDDPMDRPDIEPPRPPPKPVEYRPTTPIPIDQAAQRLLDIIENSKGD